MLCRIARQRQTILTVFKEVAISAASASWATALANINTDFSGAETAQLAAQARRNFASAVCSRCKNTITSGAHKDSLQAPNHDTVITVATGKSGTNTQARRYV